jgi:hypothetical protein
VLHVGASKSAQDVFGLCGAQPSDDLEGAGIQGPEMVNRIKQKPIEGVPYTSDTLTPMPKTGECPRITADLNWQKFERDEVAKPDAAFD